MLELASLSGGDGSSPNSSAPATAAKSHKSKCRMCISRTADSLETSSQDEDELEQKRRLEAKNPMFPKI